MKKQIQEYITKHSLFEKSDKILIGLSGGRDSVFLSLILKELGYHIALAHCNFSLRGKESDQDEAFVLNFAKQQHLECFNIKFETSQYASKKGISIQMAARELRYDWFEDVRLKNNYNYIAIAHNQDDVIETFFINLIRGTGIEGLTGIKSRNGAIVRPLLEISREQINEFINERSIDFREDSSNASTKYIRNKLRHHILPQIRSISSAFNQTMSRNIEQLNQVNQIYKAEIEKKKNETFLQFSEQIRIKIDRLKELKPISTYLYEFLKAYGFSSSTIKDIELSLEASSGKKFFSAQYQIIKDRNELILSPIHKATNKDVVFFDQTTTELESPLYLKTQIVDAKTYQIQKDPHIAALDFDKLKFPLQIRLWKHGDFFMPLGMNRMKKLSDFFIDQKISLTEKENSYIVQSKNDIVWVVDKRIDDRYKITADTQKVFLITTKK